MTSEVTGPALLVLLAPCQVDSTALLVERSTALPVAHTSDVFSTAFPPCSDASTTFLEERSTALLVFHAFQVSGTALPPCGDTLLILEVTSPALLVLLAPCQVGSTALLVERSTALLVAHAFDVSSTFLPPCSNASTAFLNERSTALLVAHALDVCSTALSPCNHALHMGSVSGPAPLALSAPGQVFCTTPPPCGGSSLVVALPPFGDASGTFLVERSTALLVFHAFDVSSTALPPCSDASTVCGDTLFMSEVTGMGSSRPIGLFGA